MGYRAVLNSEKPTKWVALAAGFVLAAALGVVDYYTGDELVLASLYVLPIGLVSWYASSSLGVGMAVTSAGILWTVGVASGAYERLPIHWANTSIRLVFFLIIVVVLSALRHVLGHLKEVSRFDSLTGALNSASLYEALDTELERLGRYGHPLSLAYVDLDGFKSVNDGSGHLVGDNVLKLVATSAKSRLRKTDMVARMGGDEFAFLCPETDEAAARAVVTGVVERLDEEMSAGDWPVTFSIGVVTCHEAPDGGSQELVKMADDLMYSVKLGTKNGVKYASYGCARSEDELCDEEALADALRS